MTLFLGRQVCTVNKTRVIIPSQFKDILPEESPDPAKESIKRVVVTIGPNREILVYPVKAWEEIYWDYVESDNEDLEEILDLVYTQTIEGPGRIRLSDELQELTGIKDKVEAVIRGEGSHMSIWHPAVYDDFKKKFKPAEERKSKSNDYRVKKREKNV